MFVVAATHLYRSSARLRESEGLVGMSMPSAQEELGNESNASRVQIKATVFDVVKSGVYERQMSTR